MKDIVYPRPNRRKCYWLCRDCIKGRSQCSTKCPDYVSVAKAERARRERNHNGKTKRYAEGDIIVCPKCDSDDVDYSEAPSWGKCQSCGLEFQVKTVLIWNE